MALDPKRRRRSWLDWLRVGAFFAFYVAMIKGPPRFIPAEWTNWIAGAVAVAFWSLVIWMIVRFVRDEIRDRRAFRTLHDVRDGGRWPLGARYAVELDAWCNGGRVWHTMRIDERGVTFRPRAPLSRRIDFVGIDVVHVHASWIEIVSGNESVRVVPRSYADRERMLWELAVRWPDALNRGIDAIAAHPAAPADVSPAAPVDVDDLDRRMTGSGLASALAGPMNRANPAPPRNSGLGNGLFVVPTDDAK
jgi:hypothetical protein